MSAEHSLNSKEGKCAAQWKNKTHSKEGCWCFVSLI
jgi:hypothetical protein